MSFLMNDVKDPTSLKIFSYSNSHNVIFMRSLPYILNDVTINELNEHIIMMVILISIFEFLINSQMQPKVKITISLNHSHYESLFLYPHLIKIQMDQVYL